MTKAIAILLMVIGHSEFIYWYGFTKSLIFSFHMPLFFIVSGYMHKQKSIRETFNKSVESLLYTYITFGAVAYLFLFFFRDAPISSLWKVLINANTSSARSFWFTGGYTIGPIWFLIALFWGRLFFTAVLHYFSRWHLPICLLLSILAVQCALRINVPLGILYGISSLVFLSIGYQIKQSGVTVAFLLLCVIIWPFSMNYPLDMAGFLYDNYFLNVIGAIGGTACCFFLSTIAANIKIINKFEFFGRYSLHVLCWHYLIMNVFPVATGKLYSSIFVISPFVVTFFAVKYRLFTFMFKPVWKSKKVLSYLNKLP